MITVMIGGDFGRLHQGHIDHILKSYALGDFLYIVTHPDEGIRERKHYEPIPLWARIIMLRGILSLVGGKGEVILALDSDGSMVETLRHYHPTFYAKGGEYNDQNMLPSEVKICKEMGIQIIYGVGERLSQSRDLQ